MSAARTWGLRGVGSERVRVLGWETARREQSQIGRGRVVFGLMSCVPEDSRKPRPGRPRSKVQGSF